MRALIYDGVETLGFRDVPDPTSSKGEHLIRVDATARRSFCAIHLDA
jgi:hypothetical protein